LKTETNKESSNVPNKYSINIQISHSCIKYFIVPTIHKNKSKGNKIKKIKKKNLEMVYQDDEFHIRKSHQFILTKSTQL